MRKSTVLHKNREEERERELVSFSRGPPTFSDFVTNCTIEWSSIMQEIE